MVSDPGKNLSHQLSVLTDRKKVTIYEYEIQMYDKERKQVKAIFLHFVKLNSFK
jgi:hypothetical protein